MGGGAIENLCRICSGPGGHGIFAPIPIYLHENPNEHLNWKKNISLLISEVIGLPVIKNDGLPQNICVICISYLKHASIFRQQAINNILSIKTAKLIVEDDNLLLETNQSVKNVVYDDKFKMSTDKLLINDNIANNIRIYDVNNYKRNLKKITNDSYTNNISNSKKNVSDESDTTEDDDQITSSDNNKLNDEDKRDLKSYVSKNLINYNERNFEEDDITTLDIFKNNNVIFNVPEHFKERKCHTCRRCFMFKETYEEHINGCIELKFVQFINDVKKLLKLKRTKTLSSYEFIRRIIYAIKKGYIIINEYCNEFKINNDLQNDSPTEPKNIIKIQNDTLDNLSLILINNDKLLFNNINILNNNSKTPNTITDNSVDECDDENDKADIDMYDKHDVNKTITDNLLVRKSAFMLCKQCNINFKNLISLENHNYTCHNNDITNLLNKHDDEDDDFNLDGIVNIIDNNLFNFNTKSSNAVNKENKYLNDNKLFKKEHITPKLSNNVNNCNYSISSIPSTKPPSTVCHNKILNNSFANAFATLPAIKLSSQPTFLNQFNNYNVNNNKSMKTIKCMKCDKRFITISHLDEHLSRVHKS